MNQEECESEKDSLSAVVVTQRNTAETMEEVERHQRPSGATQTTTAEVAWTQSDSPRKDTIDRNLMMTNNNDSDGNNELDDESTTKLIGTGLRRRKGKIMSCAKETIENASRLIRRRVPCAGHLMTPRRLWLNKVPTQCDVVIEFSETASEEMFEFLLGKLRTSPPTGLGLSVLIRSQDSSKLKGLYLTAPINVLFKAAEEARLPKRLRPDLGGALKEFTTRESHCFAQIKDTEGGSSLFTSQERQWLVLQILQGLRAGPSDVAALREVAATVAEGQSIIAAWQESSLITQVFPLHETFALTQLQTSWVKTIFAPQPLDDIAEYFGVKVALYFAWLGHYTCALGVPAVFGTLLWAGLYGRSETAQDIGHVLFSLFNVAWASLYLEAWKRYSVELAFRWGTLSTPPELLEPPRPLYKGPLEESLVTGRLEPREAPAWKRRAFRYLVSFPVIGLCLLLVFGVMFAMLRFQDWWDDKLPENGLMSCLSVIPKVLLAGAITLMDEAYYKLAVWLNDRENYRLQSKYENHLIAKVALFQFVNSFLSLFYIAFYLRDQEKLKEQLAGLLISRQIIGNLRESVWPYVVEQWRLATLSFNMYGALSPTQAQTPMTAEGGIATTTTPSSTVPPSTAAETVTKEGTPAKSSNGDGSTTTKGSTESLPKRAIGQAEIESCLYKYDGTFSDHLEMLVQMGYVVLFSAAFPLAGLCALANNILEIRSDAFKLAHVHQRPFGQRVANIGTWQNALSLLSLAAVIVNCALIGLSGQVSRLWPGLSSTQTVVLIVALEHVMLGLRSALTWLLPELPSWLAAEIARAEHCRREMQCKGTSPRQTPPSEPSSTPASQPETNTPLDPLEAFGGSTEEHYIEDFEFDQFAGSSPPYIHTKMDDSDSVFEDTPQHMASKVITPLESPISQTSTVLIRPLMESSANSQSSIQNNGGGCSEEVLPFTSSNGACRLNLKQDNIADIPPFRGGSHRNSMTTATTSSTNKHALRNASIKAVSQPIQIPEIPPFRRRRNNSQSSSTQAAGHHQSPSPSPIGDSILAMIPSTSPPRIPEIPAFKARKSTTDWTPPASHVEHNLTIASSTGVPEWAKRLKNNDSPHLIHRSTDCIAKELTKHGVDICEAALKNAPSWTALGTGASSSGHAQSSSSSSTSQAQSHSHKSHHLLNLLHHNHPQHSNTASSSKSTADSPVASSSSTAGVAAATGHSGSSQEKHKGSVDAGKLSIGSDDEAAAAAVKAAEAAAKKSRLKQSLVKRARSVAIFSLKLKERRQREAEKATQAAIEHAKIVASAVAPPPPGGELSFLTIEQLISVDDVVKHRNSASGSGAI